MSQNDLPLPVNCCGKPAAAATSTGFSRRGLLLGAGVAAAGMCAWSWWRRLVGVKQTPVFLARNQRYDGGLRATIEDGLRAVGFDLEAVRGKRVLLKPNLVEPFRDAPQVTTHPAMVLAAAEVFLRHGAHVTVGEAPGHVRDTEMALFESGLDDALRGERLEFIDLNYADVCRRPNLGRQSKLHEFWFPEPVTQADLIVSLPKLKTHHWMGFTAAMKNLYGTLPGLVYGWPKNVLHFAGIPETVVDIAASLPPTIGIVDGILTMEGDGPILGTPKPLGLVAVGTQLASLDATLGRLMGFEPARVPYLELADGMLGPIGDWAIAQRGERWQTLATRFETVDVPHLKRMLAG